MRENEARDLKKKISRLISFPLQYLFFGYDDIVGLLEQAPAFLVAYARSYANSLLEKPSDFSLIDLIGIITPLLLYVFNNNVSPDYAKEFNIFLMGITAASSLHFISTLYRNYAYKKRKMIIGACDYVLESRKKPRKKK